MAIEEPLQLEYPLPIRVLRILSPGDPRSTVSFTEAWDKVDGDDNPVYSTTSNYFLTKTITYTDEARFRRDAENLERLKEAKFDIIKI